MDVVSMHTNSADTPCSVNVARTAEPIAPVTQDRQGGGRFSALARRVTCFSKQLQQSVWAPLLVRSIVVVGGMLGLAAIGATSKLERGANRSIAAQTASLGGSWLPATEQRSAESPAPPREDPRVAPAEPSANSATNTQDGPGFAAGPQSDAEPANSAPAQGVTSEGKIILNTADASELTRLPGVGPKRADAIVRLRERLKGFRRTTDLLRVRGIGVRTLKKMLPHLVLNPPKEESPTPPPSQE